MQNLLVYLKHAGNESRQPGMTGTGPDSLKLANGWSDLQGEREGQLRFRLAWLKKSGA